ncbi:MAG: trypsin-like peptidase domain-containing protein [Acidobacteria bacterium]|nr:trypsin-like peptidase domain-containing protein [Acidobacteriota bacterium]
MRYGLIAGVMAALLLSVASVDAQDQRAAMRETAKKWQGAIVNVRVSLKVRMSMAGREVQSMDDTVEAVATVIDPSGLTVMSLSSLDPGAMMSRIIGASAQADQKMSIVSEPTDVRIRLADGKELPATIVLRDQDLDLAFIRPTATPVTPLIAVNLADAGTPAVLDELVVLSRLGRVGGWTPSAILYSVGAIMEKPRTFFVLNGQPGTGTPAFQANGKIVGLLTIRQIDPGRMSMFGMMGGTEGAGVIAVVLPAADVLEIAKQADERK